MTWEELQTQITDAFNAGNVDTLNQPKENYAHDGDTLPKVTNELAWTSLSDMVPKSLQLKYTGHDGVKCDGFTDWDEFTEEAAANKDSPK